MSVDVTVEQSIARPPAEVARFAMDPANDARWITALDSVRTLTDGPVGKGTQVARVASFLGKRMEYVNVIDVYEPPRRLVMRSVKAPFPMRVTYDFDAAPGGTLARIRAEGSAGGFYRVAGPLLGTAVRRGIAKDLKTLRGLLEGRGSASSGRAG